VRSLFLRIFLTFWFATVLLGATLVALALTTDPRAAVFRRHEQRLARLGQDLVASYEAGGGTALPIPGPRRFGGGDPPVFLFRDGEGPLSGASLPPMARRLAAEAAETGERQLRRGRRGVWLAMPLSLQSSQEQPYVLVAEVPPPSRVEMLLDPYGLTLRLGFAFGIIGVVSYFLARFLAAPIRELRRATRQLAEGDLTARVGPTLGSRRDESAELGRDFDRMAGRIEALVGAQKRLLGDISHELRSPLARLGVALGLARQKGGAGVEGSLDRIEREAERLNELIGELLTLTRLEGGGEGLAREAVDLAGLVRAVVADADYEVRARGRSVRVEVCTAVAVQGVPELLRRALENVVRNAARFTAEGTEVEVSLLREGATVRVTVRDHGPGVPEASLADLFRPFYRVADARDRQSGGTGIGLAITDRAVRLHGGSVRAANAPGGGLAVTLDLPALSPEACPAS